jgi:Tfp pilus assembly protein PilX
VKHIKENRKGQALIVVLLIGIVILILIMTLTSSVTKSQQQNNQNYDGQLAFTTAQSEAQNGVNQINNTNNNNKSPQNISTTKSESCTVSSASSHKNCQYNITSNGLTNTTTINLPHGVMLPINLLSSLTGLASSTSNITYTIAGATGDSLQVIYLTGSSGSEKMNTKIISSISSSYTNTLRKSSVSVLYLELLGKKGGTVTYSGTTTSSATTTTPHTGTVYADTNGSWGGYYPPQGIWNIPNAKNGAPNGVPLVFANKFTLASPQTVTFHLFTDDTSTIYLNGNPIYFYHGVWNSSGVNKQTFPYTIPAGANTIDVFAENTDGQNPVSTGGPYNPADLSLQATTSTGNTIVSTGNPSSWTVYQPSSSNPYIYRGTNQSSSGTPTGPYTTSSGIPTGPSYLNLP